MNHTVRAILAGISLLALSATTALAQQETVTIGWTGPLSGGAALYGKNTLTGMEMAAREVNEAGGLDVAGKKYKVEIIGLDDKYSPSESAVNAKRLRAQYKAPVVFCPHSGGNFAMQAFNEQDGFLIGAYTSVPQMTERGNKLTLRIPPSFAGYLAPFTKIEMGTYGKKLGMAGADHDYAKAWAGLMVPAWKSAGGTVVAENPMSYNKDTDFYSGVSRVIAGNPDVMFVGGAEAVAPEAVKPPPAAATVAPAPAVSAPAASQSLGVRRVLFVTRPSGEFGDAEARASNAFLPSEKVITYIEPVGETLVPVAGGDVRFGMVVDYDVRTKAGAILAAQKAVIDKEFTVGKDTLRDGNPKFYFDFTLGIAGVDPGDYLIAFTLRDKFSDRTTAIERPFTVLAMPAAAAAPAAAPVPAPAPAAGVPTTPAPGPVVSASPPSPASGLCAQPVVRTDLMTSVNGAPDFKDGKRRLKDLAEPETVFEDRNAKRMTCRYTSVWDETQDTGKTEKRMKMIFKISDDGKGGIDLDYSFDK